MKGYAMTNDEYIASLSDEQLTIVRDKNLKWANQNSRTKEARAAAAARAIKNTVELERRKTAANL